MGRGRISAEHHGVLSDAVKDGARIDGYAPVEVKTSRGETRTRNESVRAGTDTAVADVSPPLHAEKEWEAYAFVDGSKVPVGMREVCSNGIRLGFYMSLTYCPCDNHTVSTVLTSHTDPVEVHLTRRTTPLPARRW